MSSAELLKNEIVTTLTLGMTRGADVEELAEDILHELLEAGTDDVEHKSHVFITLRSALKFTSHAQ